jgi:hypothetical protein
VVKNFARHAATALLGVGAWLVLILALNLGQPEAEFDKQLGEAPPRMVCVETEGDNPQIGTALSCVLVP